MQTEFEIKKVQEVCEAYKASRDNLVAPKNEDWDRYDKLYHSKLDRRKYPLRSNLFIPLVFTNIETEIPMIISAIFKAFPIVRCRPSDNANIEAAQKNQHLIMHQMLAIRELVTKFTMFTRGLLEFGDMYASFPWQQEWRWAFKKEPKYSIWGQSFGEKVKQYKHFTFNGPDFQPLNPWDVFPDPGESDFQKARYIIQRVIVDRQYIEEMSEKKDENGQPKDALLENTGDLLEMRSNPYSLDDFEVNRYEYTNDHNGKSRPDSVQEYELLFYWTDRGELSIVGNRQYLVGHKTTKEGTYPFRLGQRPFIKARNIPILGKPAGISEVACIEMLQYEYNDMTNIGMDSAAMLGSLMLMCNRAAKVGDVIIQPGGKIYYNEQPPIPVQWPNILQNVFAAKDSLKFEMGSALGISDLSKGQRVPVVSETATGVSALMGATMSRLDLKIRMIQSMVVEAMGVHFHELNKQFITEPVTKNVGGAGFDKFMTITPDEIDNDFTFQYVGNYGYGDINIKRQEDMALFEKFSKTFPPNVFNSVEFAKDLARDDFFWEDVDKYFPNMAAPPPGMAPPAPMPQIPALMPGGPGGKGQGGSPPDMRMPTAANRINMLQGMMNKK